MRLTVVSLSSASEIRTLELASPRGITESGHVLFVPVPANVSLYHIDTLLQAVTPDWAKVNELTVLGFHLGLDEVLPEDVFDDVHSRVLGGSVYLLRLGADAKPSLEHVRGQKIDDLDADALIASLRAGDVVTLLGRAGASLPATEYLHYEGPSGSHYRAFVRPGFAFRSADDLDRVSFWLAEHLVGKPYVVVDHWSMMGLGHHASEYLAKVLGTWLSPVAVECVTAYGEETDAMVPRFARAFPDAGDRQVLVLLSATSSGDLAGRVMGALGTIRQTRPLAVALARAPSATAKATVQSLTDLDENYARLAAPCSQCQPDVASTPLTIDPESYLLHLAAYTKQTAITIGVAAKPREVVERYAGTGAFGVHRTHVDGRHHGYYIDLSAMLPTAAFRERLAAQLRQLVDHVKSIDAIIHPPWPASSSLATMVFEELVALGVEPPLIVPFDDEADVLKNEADLVTARSVLIVDDVVITGRRIYAYRRRLTQIRRAAAGDGRVELAALVGVARPAGEGALQGIRGVLHHTARDPRLFTVEELILPNWGTKTCSWCREITMLRRVSDQVRKHEAVASRLRHLRDERQSDLLWHWPPHVSRVSWPTPQDEAEWAAAATGLAADYSDKYYALNAGSIFGDLQGADLLVCVAATLQRMRLNRIDGQRVDSELDDRFRSPVAKTLDPYLYLLGRFYEPVLLAAILRGCHPHDLMPPEGDSDLEEGLGQHLSHLTSSSEMYGELLVQVALGLLPAVNDFVELEHPSPFDAELTAELLAARSSRR